MITSQITLFSSIVALFIIEIYKTLLPSNSPSSTVVRINIVLFLSFFLSILSAVSCALIQQWCYEYLKFAYPWAAPHESGRVRTYLFQGLDMSVRRFIYGTHALLHISVFLFFWAISDFFYSVHHYFGNVTGYTFYASAIIYVLLSASPLIFSNSPCNTPLTPLLRSGWIILLIIIRSPLWCLSQGHSQPFDLTGFPYYKGIRFDRAHLYSIKAAERAEKLEPYAMKWFFTENVLSDEDMDMFLKGLPGYISSSHTKKGQLDNDLTADYILSRIKEHLLTCVTSVELSDEASIARVSSSVKALLRIFQHIDACKSNMGKLQRTYIEKLMEEFQTLCDMDDQMIALRASCIRALAAQGFLSQLIPHDSTTTLTTPFPASLLPVYTFFFPSHNLDTIQLLLDGEDRSVEPSSVEIETMWKNFLHHGPLANLTRLAQAVRDSERAPASTLSFCWNASNILLTHLGSIHCEESTRAPSDFDNLHENIRRRVHEERGFRVTRLTRLLDILDTVARGRRLLMVFPSDSTYHNRADVVFGKKYLRNSDLLEAFAYCLPGFISENPNTCKEFMEKVVRHDNLWTCLQGNLSNTKKSNSDSPTPEKLRVFGHCCTVLDLVFSVLEDSLEVDWRSPEFGSLSQRFNDFQGALTTIDFRVDVINARFCKALLAQFWNDLDCKGIVSFRSRWDVISLGRLVRTLGLVRDDEDKEFRDSFVNRGRIGAEFTAKALEIIHRTERDGPLLIFCQLGHLVVMAVPLDHSGLKSEDLEKVTELQRSVIKKRRKSLNEVSEIVWETLDGLQTQVKNLCVKHSSKNRDIKILGDLLQMIEGINNLRLSKSEGPNQTDPAEEQGPTSAAVDLTSSSGELRRIGNQSGPPSELTAVVEGPSSVAQADEGGGGFERTSSLSIPRSSIDSQTDLSADRVLDRERMSYGRPESSRSYELSSHSLPSPHPPVTVQGIPSVEMMVRSVSEPLPGISSYFPYMGGGQRPFTRQPSSGFSTSTPTLVSTRAPSKSRRDASPALPKLAISPPMDPLASAMEE